MSGDRLGAWLIAVSVGWTCLAVPAAAQQSAPAAPVQAVPPPAAAPALVKPPAEPSAEAKERARSAYTRGQAAFAQGDFASAKDAFQQAFDSVPNPIVLLSLAESATKLGKVDEAIAAFDRYLQLRPDAPDRADIEQKRAALAVTPAQLSIVSDPPGAEILVDAQPTGRVTPAQLQVSPGQHQVELALPEYEKSQETLQVAPGARIERSVALQKPAPPPIVVTTPPPSEVPATPVREKPKVPTAALWVTGGLGAAGLIAGSVLGFLALKEHSDYDARPTESSADRGERLALFADVGFGVGAMAIITAAVLFLTYDEVPPETQALRVRPSLAAAPRFELVPRVSPNAASASARIRF